MKVNIQELIRETGSDENIYPGKRIVHKYMQPGEFKSHCVVFDWRAQNLRVELKAGLTGKDLKLADLKQYPVSYQAPTFIELAAQNDDKTEEEEDGEAKGKSGGGGGKKPAMKKLEDSNLSLSAFGKAVEGIIPTVAEIKKFVVMGKELAKEAYAQAFDNFKQQLHQTKVMAMDIMKNVGNIIKKATPGGGLQAKGDESIKYKYDSEKTAPLFGSMTLG